jgi:1-aminocyclopropane-1-carboxylate deaminase
MRLGSFGRRRFPLDPSPVHPLAPPGAHLGGARLWAKRDDDGHCGIAFGGTKIRNVEYLVAEAIAQRCDTLVSIRGFPATHAYLGAQPALDGARGLSR